MTDNYPFCVAASDTSRAAAEAVAPSARSLRDLVERTIKAQGTHGATDDELLALTGLAPNTARPRRNELVDAGKVRGSGKHRATRSGCQAAVWVWVAPADRDAALGEVKAEKARKRMVADLIKAARKLNTGQCEEVLAFIRALPKPRIQVPTQDEMVPITDGERFDWLEAGGEE